MSPTVAVPRPAPLDIEQRRALLRRLVAETRAYHVFTPQTEKNLGTSWEARLPRLSAEFDGADTPERLTTALNHFANSLHDPHCFYEPPAPLHVVVAGFSLAVEWIDSRPRFYVNALEEPLAQRLSVGDILVSAEGVPAEALLEAHALESSANSWRGIARDVARYLGRRAVEFSSVSPGARSRLEFRSRDTSEPRPVEVEWHEPPAPAPAAPSETSVDYDATTCAGLPEVHYGSYRLFGVGRNFCVYASEEPPFRVYPIVRQFSFLYSDLASSASRERVLQQVRADRDHLERLLAALPVARAVLLDLRDNGGGNEANWFLDWWAPGPWVEPLERYRLHEDFVSDPALSERLRLWGPFGLWYRRALASRRGGDTETPPRLRSCVSEECGGPTPRRAEHRVVRTPVALVVGPGCASSCDSFALAFSESRLGPLVGEPTSAGYSSKRLPLELGEGLGALRLAVSRAVSARTGEDIEAVPLPLDRLVESTFDARAAHDAALVRAAIDALEQRAAGASPWRKP